MTSDLKLLLANSFNLLRNKSVGSYAHLLATPFIWKSYDSKGDDKNCCITEEIVTNGGGELEFLVRPITTRVALLNREVLNLNRKWIKTSYANGACKISGFKNLTLPSNADIGYGPGIYKNLYRDRGSDFTTGKRVVNNRDGTYLYVSKFKGKLRDGLPCFDYEFYDNKYMYFGNIFVSKYENIQYNHESGLILAPPHSYFDAKYIDTNAVELDNYGGTYGVSVEMKGISFIKSKSQLMIDGMSFGGFGKFEYRIHPRPIKLSNGYLLYDFRNYTNSEGVFIHIKSMDSKEFKMEFSS